MKWNDMERLKVTLFLQSWRRSVQRLRASRLAFVLSIRHPKEMWIRLDYTHRETTVEGERQTRTAFFTTINFSFCRLTKNKTKKPKKGVRRQNGGRKKIIFSRYDSRDNLVKTKKKRSAKWYESPFNATHFRMIKQTRTQVGAEVCNTRWPSQIVPYL